MEVECLALDQSETWEAPYQALERELSLKLPERGAQAIVNTFTKGECPGGIRTARIEHLGLRKDGRITAGGSEP
jgi:hypothetical protein